ncbi:MAG: hypothetical protein RLZZ303_3087 [Candidatus Hydrogenedentota bacterium]
MQLNARPRADRFRPNNAVLAAFVFLAGALPALGEPGVARFETPGARLVLTPHVRWVVEENGPLEPAEAARRLETAPVYGGESEWLELGLMQGVIWIAVTIENQAPVDNLVFEFRNPRMSYVDFYHPDGEGGYDVTLCGVARPFDVRPFTYPMPAFPMELGQGERVTVLLRLENNGDFRQRVWLWDSAAFTNRAATAYLSDMMTTGVLVVLAIYQLLVFVLLRERSYFYLFCFVSSWALFLMAGTGMAKMFLWQDFYWLNQRANSVFLMGMIVSFMLFAMDYLEARKHAPALRRLGLLYVGGCVAYTIYFSFIDTVFRMTANPLIALAAMIYLIILAFRVLYRGGRNARFFLGAWGFMLTGVTLLLLLGWYVLPSSLVLGTPAISILFTVSILAWSLELIGRVRVREREQRRLLETQVEERTRELRQALHEVKTLSGLLPICSSCKKIRDDTGYWQSVEHYIARHTGADFTHGICPECTETLYPELADIRKRRQAAENA